MKKKTKPIDKINTKLTIFITCVVVIITAVISCSVNLATGIAYMKSLSQAVTTAPYLYNTTASEESTTSPAFDSTDHTACVSTLEDTSIQEIESTAKNFDTSTTKTAESSTRSTERKAEETTVSVTADTTAPSTSAAVERQNEIPSAGKTEYSTQKTEKENDGKYYITASGTKYHLSSCSYLKKSMIEISLSEAIEKGYKPCSKCIE